jgi:uncharacterized membrane protein YkvA (DUF1232 family)
MIERVCNWARTIRREGTALYIAVRDPCMPWYARALGAAVVAYALSPIDLIPDFIPVIGQIDDLLIVPLGMWLAVRLIPVEVIADARAAAEKPRDGDDTPPTISDPR